MTNLDIDILFMGLLTKLYDSETLKSAWMLKNCQLFQ